MVCLGPRVALLVVDLSSCQSLLLWFGLLRTSSGSARCRLDLYLFLKNKPEYRFNFCIRKHINSNTEVYQSVFVADYLPGPNVSMPRLKTVVDAYIYINKLDARLDSLAFPVIRD